ncbi:ribosome silencing factor [Oscillatoria sp. FACHB-1407]|uniref:ribosome silencing factor n=1 Tax=Oscillatoria sp. FACHB-1407 TaxID=2692847 RepID=UPI001682EEE0|nr:ribosome silencing factor [Oscillatoria sp. FACHB-1407]MBD2462885.1 ribosome silencing factor [Oscillatoria sp. FACHB-1407]
MTHFSNIETTSSTLVAAKQNQSASAPTATESSYQLALAIAQAMDDRKGADIVVLDVSDVSYLADYFVIATGFSSVQVRAIARSIEDHVEENLHRLPVQLEGQTEGSWVLLDYGDVIAHIFLPEEREFYNLEAFWGHAKRTSFAAINLTSGQG